MCISHLDESVIIAPVQKWTVKPKIILSNAE
jgi:hypothetical protein